MEDRCIMCGADVSDMGTQVCKNCVSKLQNCEQCIYFMSFHNSTGLCLYDYGAHRCTDTCDKFEEESS